MATDLTQDGSGVNVIPDKWEPKPGQDAAAFMEKMRADPKIRRVVMICDRIYAEKADGRAGCVGMEARIISAEVYARPSRNS